MSFNMDILSIFCQKFIDRSSIEGPLFDDGAPHSEAGSCVLRILLEWLGIGSEFNLLPIRKKLTGRIQRQ